MAFRIKVLPSEETKEKHEIRDDSRYLNWALNPLTKLMCCVGLPPPSGLTVSSTSTRYLIDFIRILIFFLVFFIQIHLVINICLNSNSVTMSYANGYSSGTVAWNFIIDGCNISFYIVVNHAFLLFLTRPKPWKILTDSIKILEENSTATLEIYKKCRETLTLLMKIVLTTVIIHY